MFVIHVLEPFASGVSTAVISITQQLQEIKHLIIHGSRMWVDSLEKVKGRFPKGTEFLSWPFADREISLKKDIKAAQSLYALLKDHRDAIVHLHSSKAGFTGRLDCRRLGIKRVIYTPHGASFVRTDIKPLERQFFRLLEGLGASFGGEVIGCGRSEAVLYRKLGCKGRYVSNGVPISPLNRSAAANFVTFVGIASVQKDPLLFNSIASSTPGDFLWIGDGPLRASLQAPNITVTGWQDKAQVDAYLAQSLVYLSTSAWEGLPFGVLEAMNAGCALLLRDVPGNRELVIPGQNGYLFNTVEQASLLLKQMLEDKPGTRTMGLRSHDLVAAEYSIEQMGRGYLEIYQGL